MPQRPPLFPKLHVSTKLPEPHSATSTMASFSGLSSSQHIVEGRTQHQIIRAKRKHVLKACDRCRVKKTKCDGNQPCYRCAAYNHPCLFRERKVTQTKAYSRGFVEMLESHHALVVKALQQLYTHCINNECFPGDPIDLVDGNPCTHAILDRLGLIKQAEEEPEKIAGEICWKDSPKSSGSVETGVLSPEPADSLEFSPSSKSASVSPSELNCVKIEPSMGGPCVPYLLYHGAAHVWPMQTPGVEFNHSYPTPFGMDSHDIPNEPSSSQTYLSVETTNSFISTGERPVELVRPCLQVDGSVMYPHVNAPSLHHGAGDTGNIQSQYSWVPGNLNR